MIRHDKLVSLILQIVYRNWVELAVNFYKIKRLIFGMDCFDCIK